MHTDKPLMEELKKMKRVIQKKSPNGPDEIIAVIDANTGKNALEQCRVYHEALGLTGLVLSKFDGTAKGGILLTVADELNIPIAFLGLGEQVDDLEPFNAQHYLKMLFSKQ